MNEKHAFAFTMAIIFLTLCGLLGYISSSHTEVAKPEPMGEEVLGYERLPDYIRRVDDHERGVSCYYRNSGQFSCVQMSK